VGKRKTDAALHWDSLYARFTSQRSLGFVPRYVIDAMRPTCAVISHVFPH